MSWTSNFTAFLRGKRRPRLDPRQLGAEPELSLDTALGRLRAERSGMMFIYSAMDLFAAHFALDDVVVVFHDGHGGKQIFRLGGKPISPDRKSLITADPGVYCYPKLDDVEDTDLLFERCKEEFDALRARGNASTGVITPRPSRERPRKEPRRGDEALDVAAPIEVEDPQEAGSSFGVETWRVFASKLFVVVTVINIVLALLDVTGSVRFVLGLLLGIAIPGWSIVGLIHFRDTALEIALTIAASFAIVMLGAQLMITWDFWHLEAFEVFLCLVCLPSLLYQADWHRRLPWRPR